MVKKIILVLLLVLCFNITACGNFDYDSLLNDIVPNGSSVLVWPDSELSNMIPKPESKVGEIIELTNDLFVVNVGDVSKEDFGKYVNSCMQRGFIQDLSYNSNVFSAKHEAGYILNIQYSSSKVMFIELKKQTTVNDNAGDENDDLENPTRALQVCVGSESKFFYQEKLDYFAEINNLPFTIEVIGVDTGSYPDYFLMDPANGADIFVAAQDSMSRLLRGFGAIAPIMNQDLINQIDCDVDLEFRNVVKNNEQYYAVPIIKQSLVLYYNKAYFSSPSECDTWEEILVKANQTGKLATCYIGEDGYNYSHWLLAKPINAAAINTFGRNGTLELYKDGIMGKNMLYGDDQVAIHHYAQRFTAHANGRNGSVVGQNWWEQELMHDESITLVAGPWNYLVVNNILGEENLGITVLPKFTLTAEDAYGSAKAGMQFQSGSFYDVKCLFKKKDSAYAEYLDEIMLFMSSVEIQTESFICCNNLPAYNGFDANEVYNGLTQNEVYNYGITQTMIDLANAQIKQGEAAGTPQPFGQTYDFNPIYYSKAGGIILDIHQNLDGNYSTLSDIKSRLQYMSYILANDKIPSDMKEVLSWVNNR